MSPGAEHMRQSVIADRLDQPEGPDDDMPIVMAVVDVPGGQWTVSSARKGTQIKCKGLEHENESYRLHIYALKAGGLWKMP